MALLVQAATLYYAEGGSFDRVADTQRSSENGEARSNASTPAAARGTSVTGGYHSISKFTCCIRAENKSQRRNRQGDEGRAVPSHVEIINSVCVLVWLVCLISNLYLKSFD